MATIDRGDAHFEDAGDWPEACYHMGVFLLWAARRGLAAREHVGQLARLAAAPGDYVVDACDTKLLPDDFTASETVIRELYDEFLAHFGNLVVTKTSRAYVVGLDAELLASVDRFLDRELQRLAPKLASRGPALGPGGLPPTIRESTSIRRVRHAKFGRGVIVGESTEGGRARVTVDFVGIGRKTLLASFVEPIDE